MREPANDESNAVADTGRPDEQPDYLFLSWHLEEKLNAFIETGDPPQLGLRCVLNLIASQMDHIAIARDGQRQYVLALLLRDKLTALIDNRRLPDRGLQRVLHEAVSLEVLAHDAGNMMNPGLWRNLPAELLEQVFARLPLQCINKLQFVSRKWRDELTTPFSAFNQLIIDAHPNLVTLVAQRGYPPTEYHVRTFDSSKNTWDASLSYHFSDQQTDMMRFQGVTEGFFLCESLGVNRRVFHVFNLLTRVRYELPPLDADLECGENKRLFEMMHMKVNPKAKCYTVFFVYFTNGSHNRVTVHVYDSRLKSWTTKLPPLGRMEYDCKTWVLRDHSVRRTLFHVVRVGFDFGALALDVDHLVERGDEPHAIDMALYGDREFELRKVEHDGTAEMVPEKFFILEYQAHEDGTCWVHVRTHWCPDFGNYLGDECEGMYLLASEGILMVMIRSRGMERCWHLDLSTGVWCVLPEYASPPSEFNMMFRTW